jgi:hypothetical protein
MAQLRKAVIIQKLQSRAIFEVRDGRALEIMSADELELELAHVVFGEKGGEVFGKLQQDTTIRIK